MANRTEPSESVVKTLFAMSGNVCAYQRQDGRACEEKLTDPSWPRVMAVVAHIRGLREGSARFDPSMTPEERNRFDNLIVLCRNCHQRVDELEPDLHPPERLYEMKERHLQRFGTAEHQRRWTNAELDRVTAIVMRMQFRVEADGFVAHAEGEAFPPAAQVKESPALADTLLGDDVATVFVADGDAGHASEGETIERRFTVDESRLDGPDALG